MQKYQRSIIGIALLVIVLVLIYIRDTQNAPTIPMPKGQIFPMINETQLRTVRLTDTSGRSTPLEIVWALGGNWAIPGSSQPLDQEVVNVLLAVVANMSYVDDFMIAEDDLDNYGLEGDGRFVVEFITDSQLSTRLTIGDRGSEELTYFVRVNDITRVFVVERGPIDFLMIQQQQPPIRI